MAETAVVQRIDSEGFALVAHQTKRFHVRVIDTHVDERDNLVGQFDRSSDPETTSLPTERIKDYSQCWRILLPIFYRLPANRLILALNLEPVSARAPQNRVVFRGVSRATGF